MMNKLCNSNFLDMPIVQEITYQDPIHIFSIFQHQKWSLFLDSANGNLPFENTNRYSYIAIDPFMTLTYLQGKFLETNTLTEDPFQVLQTTLKNFVLPTMTNLPPFQGGMAGFFSYDLCHQFESIKKISKKTLGFVELAIGFYDVVISFDHLLKRAWIISSGFPEKTYLQKIRAVKRLQDILLKIDCSRMQNFDPLPKKFVNNIYSNFTEETYCQAVHKSQQYILDGDIFQVNLSQCFSTKTPKNILPFELYRKLRLINPSPFSAYFNINPYFLVSSSPERFVQLKNNQIETRPIKGTIARNVCDDQEVQLQLQNNPKERAENIMIVDLVRNDFSKVCEVDSVIVEKLCGLETYPTVHHLVSVIKGTLCPELHAIDVLKAIFPAGSVTGAPKIRAIEIIAELEPHNRGPYCGHCGFIGFDGTMDTSILIRTFVMNSEHIYFHAGGAITLNSDPQQEYQETLNKADALIQTVL